MSSVIDDCRQEMAQTITIMKRDLARIRTSRATTALLDGIVVDYYGAKTPLNQLATVMVPEPRLLVIQPFDRSAMSEIERAVLQSDLGLTPANDGKIIRIPIPELTEDRRRELVKHLRKTAEEFRVSQRSHRRDAIEMLKELQKEKEITEDELKKSQEQIDHVTKEYVDKIDELLKAKEEEIMAV